MLIGYECITLVTHFSNNRLDGFIGGILEEIKTNYSKSLTHFIT
jgi:transcription termination factor NusB